MSKIAITASMVTVFLVCGFVFAEQEEILPDENQTAQAPDVECAVPPSTQSSLDMLGDWFATVGKTEEEKAAILEQRRLQRSEAPVTPDAGLSSEVKSYKQAAEEKVSVVKEEAALKAKATKEKIAEEVTKIKDSVATTQENIVIQTASYKEKAQKKYEEIKGAAGAKIEQGKEQLGRQADRAIAGARGFLDNLLK